MEFSDLETSKMHRIRPFHYPHPNNWVLVSAPRTAAKCTALRALPRDLHREAVRQWVLNEIVETYNFPRDWLGRRILLVDQEHNHALASEVFGIAVTLDNGVPFLIVSVEAPGRARQAEENLRTSMLGNNTIGLGLATDGTEKGISFLRRKFDAAKCEYVSDIEPYNRAAYAQRLGPFYLDQSNKNKGQALIPLTDRIGDLFFEMHSHIRDIDGLHADEALDELCKLIYAKLFDEESANSSKPVRLQRWLYGTTEELAAAARAAYREATEYDIRVFRLKIPQYERSRGVFNTPIRLSSPAIVKVLESLQRYSLAKSDADVKGRAFQKVIGPAIRSGMGQYFTPEPVVKFMVDIVQPKVTDLILDPFCGSAHFLSKCLEYVREHIGNRDSKTYHEFAFGKLHGIEKSDRMVRVAMTDMRLHGDGHSNIRCTDALLGFSNYPDLEPESFDLILTNPPFGSLLSAESIGQLGKFELAMGKKKVPLEVLGLERCIQFLRPGGRMGIVIPDSILSNRGTGYVRDWLGDKVKLRAIISLPIETFCPFGANIKTSILFLRKWECGEHHVQDYSLFLVRMDSVGYDATGRRNDTPELTIASEKLLQFLKKEGW